MQDVRRDEGFERPFDRVAEFSDEVVDACRAGLGRLSEDGRRFSEAIDRVEVSESVAVVPVLRRRLGAVLLL